MAPAFLPQRVVIDVTNYEHVKRAREKKRLQLQALKDGKPCTRCEQVFPHYQLDWHHEEREGKEFTISRAMRDNVSWKRIFEEIAKVRLALQELSRRSRVGACDLKCPWFGHAALIRRKAWFESKGVDTRRLDREARYTVATRTTSVRIRQAT